MRRILQFLRIGHMYRGEQIGGVRTDSDRGGANSRKQEVGVMTTLLRPRWTHAENEAKRLTSFISTPPVPVYEIAESNGVNVVFADFGVNAEKVAGLCDFDNARIYVNQDDQPERQTFTMAHELGHWIMHRDFFLAHPEKYPVLPRFQAANNDDAMEKEANKFAACLLVPERLLKPVRGSPVSALASAFGVSRTMMEYRLKNV